jgi:Flp pilus assembly pilin Flp
MMTALVKRFLLEEDGLETVEYAIIAGLIVTGSISAIGSIGVWVAGKYTALNVALQGH